MVKSGIYYCLGCYRAFIILMRKKKPTKENLNALVNTLKMFHLVNPTIKIKDTFVTSNLDDLFCLYKIHDYFQIWLFKRGQINV